MRLTTYVPPRRTERPFNGRVAFWQGIGFAILFIVLFAVLVSFTDIYKPVPSGTIPGSTEIERVAK